MRAVILAAGIGSRIGSIRPKCLSELGNGQTILGHQIQALRSSGIHEIHVVVGFKKDVVMEDYPSVSFIYNPIYHRTNTAKSLLMALECLSASDILWINGDVFCPPEMFVRLRDVDNSTVSYVKGQYGAEEVKCAISSEGYITGISKTLDTHIGEAIGVNCILEKDFQPFKTALASCSENDYFEKGLEILSQDAVPIKGLDVSDLSCVEVDFSKDLDRARDFYFQSI
ncbi:MAG: UDP-N-acetylglucosamine pyrophosphorylase [Actinobacteria bacterium]|nr:UDP-N-acetylglucosamine pyrophosphorylase [Actinomycetota bacterium]